MFTKSSGKSAGQVRVLTSAHHDKGCRTNAAFKAPTLQTGELEATRESIKGYGLHYEVQASLDQA